MKVYFTNESYEKDAGAVATIGTFDGVHLGHTVILNRLIEVAKELQKDSLVISFHPHPRLVLFPEDNPLRLLQSLDERIAGLEKLGIDKLLLIPFTRDFSRKSSAQFVEEILVDTVGLKRIIIGYDHHFGRNRTGGLKDLQIGGKEQGFEVEEIPAQQIDDANVSSSKIRTALMEGDILHANRFLGYEYSYFGTVQKGLSLGHTLGFPTANIFCDDELKLIPGDGVYVCRVEMDAFIEKKFGLCSIGTRPTLGETEKVVEVYILDFKGNLYDKDIKICFLEKLRNQEKFPVIEGLIEQMKKDEVKARGIIEAQYA